jgi:hypothetical protein
MLDEGTTAQRLQKKLDAAFDRWRAKAPGRSKAQLARECAAAAQRPCTPQTVNSWFKTGRMDKLWLPVLEGIFGEPLGFGSELKLSIIRETNTAPDLPLRDDIQDALRSADQGKLAAADVLLRALLGMEVTPSTKKRRPNVPAGRKR